MTKTMVEMVSNFNSLNVRYEFKFQGDNSDKKIR